MVEFHVLLEVPLAYQKHHFVVSHKPASNQLYTVHPPNPDTISVPDPSMDQRSVNETDLGNDASEEGEDGKHG